MSDITAAKKAARREGIAVRTAAHTASPGAARVVAGYFLEAIAALRDIRVVSAYLPIRCEIDPLPAMLSLHGLGYRICVPVIEGAGLPLKFREWMPGVELISGPFGVTIPVEGAWLTPDGMLVPMIRFDDVGHRLGYGGGFYDRTIALLRQTRQVKTIGFAYEAQRVEKLPLGPFDMHLDCVVTEAGIRWFEPEMSPADSTGPAVDTL